MSNIDLSQIVTAEEKALSAAAARADIVKADCKRRILASLPWEVQTNVAQAVTMYTAALLRGASPKEASAQSGLQETDFPAAAAARGWIAQMQATARALAADPTLKDAWPPLPSGVAELAARF